MRLGKHHSRALQRAYDKHGSEGLTFRVLVVCRRQDLLLYEQRFIDAMRPAYNCAKIAGSCAGLVHSPEARAKMSAAHKGAFRPKSAAHKRALSVALTGKSIPEATRKKMSATHSGRKKKPFSEAHKAAISKARTGSKASAETREKLSMLHKGRRRSAETGEKIAAALRGKPHSDERRAAISRGCLEAAARRRAE